MTPAAARRDNPYLVFCPCCGATICTRCAALDAQVAGLCDCLGCRRQMSRIRRSRREHLAAVDHRFVDTSNEGAVIMRIDVR